MLTFADRMRNGTTPLMVSRRLHVVGLGCPMALYRLAYGRLSTREQERGYTLEMQVETLKDWGFDELFTDMESGRKTDRSGFNEMIARARSLAKSGHAVVIRVARHDRWARNVVYSLGLINELEALGVVVESRDRGRLSLGTAIDFLQTANEAVQAELESRRIGERVRNNYAARARHGRPAGNRAPFGYRYTPEKWVPGDDWALARAAAEHFLEYGNIRRLIIWLKEQGLIKSRYWASHWLQSPAIRGHSSYKGQITYNTHEPLITPTESQAILQKLQQNRELRGRNTNARRYPVATSLCVCAACGRRLTSKSRQGARYLFCRYSREADCTAPRKYCRDTWIEAAIQNEIQSQAERIIDWQQAGDDAIDPRLAEKERELQQLQKLAHVPGVPDAISALELEISQIKTATERTAADSEERETMIVDLAAMLPSDWEMLTDEQRRGIYGALVASVSVLGAEVLEVRLR